MTQAGKYKLQVNRIMLRVQMQVCAFLVGWNVSAENYGFALCGAIGFALTWLAIELVNIKHANE